MNRSRSRQAISQWTIIPRDPVNKEVIRLILIQPTTMPKVPEPKFNGYEMSADVNFPLLPGVLTINIHGELKHREVASEAQLECYQSIKKADFPAANELEDIPTEFLSEKWYRED